MCGMELRACFGHVSPPRTRHRPVNSIQRLNRPNELSQLLAPESGHERKTAKDWLDFVTRRQPPSVERRDKRKFVEVRVGTLGGG